MIEELTKQDGELVICGDHEDWKTIEEHVCDSIDWVMECEGVFLNKPSHKHYRLRWSISDDGIEDRYYYPKEVKAVEKTVTVWEPVE